MGLKVSRPLRPPATNRVYPSHEATSTRETGYQRRPPPPPPPTQPTASPSPSSPNGFIGNEEEDTRIEEKFWEALNSLSGSVSSSSTNIQDVARKMAEISQKEGNIREGGVQNPIVEYQQRQTIDTSKIANRVAQKKRALPVNRNKIVPWTDTELKDMRPKGTITEGMLRYMYVSRLNDPEVFNARELATVLDMDEEDIETFLGMYSPWKIRAVPGKGMTAVWVDMSEKGWIPPAKSDAKDSRENDGTTDPSTLAYRPTPD